MDWLDNLSPQDAHELIKDGKVALIDVREVNEFEAGCIPGASLHPLSGFDPAALPNNPDLPVLLYCAAGGRSAMAAEKYRAHYGCDRVAHIAGGIGAWAECGLPLYRG